MHACRLLYLAREANQTPRQLQTRHPASAGVRLVMFLPRPHWCSRASLPDRNTRTEEFHSSEPKWARPGVLVIRKMVICCTFYSRGNGCLVRAQKNTGAALIFDNAAVLGAQTPD